MRSKDLAKMVATRTGISNTTAIFIVNMIFDEIIAEVSQDRNVFIHGFGTFKPSTRASRKIGELNSSNTRILPEQKVPKFTPSIQFKRKLLKDG